MKLISAFACGWLFAMGLGIAGMTQPAKVIGFLDITGAFDPSLMFVMGSAVMLGLVTFPKVLNRDSPILGGKFIVPVNLRVDYPLLAGATLFGLGWGMSGYCPGPALVSLVTGNNSVIVFVFAMIAGFGLGEWLSPRK